MRWSYFGFNNLIQPSILYAILSKCTITLIGSRMPETMLSPLRAESYLFLFALFDFLPSLFFSYFFRQQSSENAWLAVLFLQCIDIAYTPGWHETDFEPVTFFWHKLHKPCPAWGVNVAAYIFILQRQNIMRCKWWALKCCKIEWKNDQTSCYIGNRVDWITKSS